MLAPSTLLGALAALLSLTVTADDPADRGLVARRLAEAGHAVVGDGASRRIHVTADAIWMASDGSGWHPVPSRSHLAHGMDGMDGMDGIRITPAAARAIPLPRGAARRLVLPHHARALAGPPQPTANTRPVVWLTGRGAVLDRAAAGLLDAGFALGWREPVLAVCLEPRSVAIARGRQCGPPVDSDDPVRDAVALARRLARPPDPPPSAPALRAPVRPPAAAIHLAGYSYALRAAVGIDSRAWVTSSLTLQRSGTLRWLAGITFRGDATAGPRLGVGLGIGERLTVDLALDATWGRGGPGWRIGLPIGLGRATRVVVEPAWSHRGPAGALLVGWSL